jgi:hypothetical protein
MKIYLPAVASSSTKILLFLNKARAIHNNCLSPALKIKKTSLLFVFFSFKYILKFYLKFSPPSVNKCEIPSSIKLIRSFICTNSNADQISTSL